MAVTPRSYQIVAVIYKLSLTVAIIYKLCLNVAVIYKPSLFAAVTPEAIKYVAFIYKPSLTCRHLHADHSGTQHCGLVKVIKMHAQTKWIKWYDSTLS